MSAIFLIALGRFLRATLAAGNFDNVAQELMETMKMMRFK
jgi:hypothetical protein